MQEVRIYNSIGKLARVISAKDLEKRSRAIIRSIISAEDRDKIKKFKYDWMESSTGISSFSTPNNEGFSLDC